MAVGKPGGFVLTRIDEYYFPAAFADVAEPSIHAGRGHQTAIGYGRICAQDQKKLRAVNVGYRKQKLVSEHQIR